MRLKLRNICFKRLRKICVREKKPLLSHFKKLKNYLTVTCLFSKGTDKAQPAAKSGKENQEKSK